MFQHIAAHLCKATLGIALILICEIACISILPEWNTAYHRLTGLEDLRHRNPLTLSGGQMQRLAIAGVLALKPECIVLDESLSMLDSESKNEVLQVLKRLNREEGLSIVLITHDIRDCADATCIYELEKGKLKRKC